MLSTSWLQNACNVDCWSITRMQHGQDCHDDFSLVMLRETLRELVLFLDHCASLSMGGE